MKLIIEREATFKNNSDIQVKVTHKIIMNICEGNTMKQDMLTSQINLTSQATLNTHFTNLYDLLLKENQI